MIMNPRIRESIKNASVTVECGLTVVVAFKFSVDDKAYVDYVRASCVAPTVFDQEFQHSLKIESEQILAAIELLRRHKITTSAEEKSDGS